MMTRDEAEKVCREFCAAKWPDGVLCEVWPRRAPDGLGHWVILNFTVHGKTHKRTLRTARMADVGAYQGDAHRLRGRNGGKPPIITTTSANPPLGPLDWVETACDRLETLNAPYRVVMAVKRLLRGLEIDAVDHPDIDELDDVISITWLAPGRKITVKADGIAVGVLVTEEGQPIPWADDSHRWPTGRAIPSLRVWLRWMFPTKEKSSNYR